ncbi:hypothetical protein Tsubulata_039646 [Turnera subulata]|uniref:Phytosulfokine-beta n=1 Tax=Turnera subulata TaxID=218843 RepID=A0A9Q0FWZ2_9ROSI|nr:hypothetical protein Tsubulata_039646 [Turnera subulata]
MRPSLLVSLLLLSILLHKVQGIRLDKGFVEANSNQNIHMEDKSAASLIQRSNGGVGEVILCKEGKCKGVDRKLFSATTSTPAATTTSKNDNGGNNVNPMQKCTSFNGELGEKNEKSICNSSPAPKTQEETYDHYVDVMDLTAMDYSPARRKPPIHN